MDEAVSLVFLYYAEDQFSLFGTSRSGTTIYPNRPDVGTIHETEFLGDGNCNVFDCLRPSADAGPGQVFAGARHRSSGTQALEHVGRGVGLLAVWHYSQKSTINA